MRIDLQAAVRADRASNKNYRESDKRAQCRKRRDIDALKTLSTVLGSAANRFGPCHRCIARSSGWIRDATTCASTVSPSAWSMRNTKIRDTQ
jgi:hypothetical protein